MKPSGSCAMAVTVLCERPSSTVRWSNTTGSGCAAAPDGGPSTPAATQQATSPAARNERDLGGGGTQQSKRGCPGIYQPAEKDADGLRREEPMLQRGPHDGGTRVDRSEG